jgi:hypothetical protein
VQAPVERPERGHPQRQRLDLAVERPSRRLQRHHVADAELILEQDEEPRQRVSDDGLRAEPERDARDAGAREERSERHVELPEHEHDGDDPDRDEPGRRQRSGERRDPLEVELLREARAPLEPAAEAAHEQRDDHGEDEGEDDDREDRDPVLAEPRAEAVVVWCLRLREHAVHLKRR